MLHFPKTNMLHEADAAAEQKYLRTGKTPPHPAVEVLLFLLVFLAATMIQSIIITPFQLVAMMTGDTFKNILLYPPTSYQETMEMVTALLSSFPDWFMVVQLLATSGTIAACFVYCRAFEKRSWVSLGFTKKGAVAEYAAGLGIGLALFGSAVAICVGTGHLTLSINSAPAIGMIFLYFLGYMIQGMSEEILCRGYLMVSMQRGCPLWVAVLTNALIFTVLHLGNPGVTPLALLNLTLFGIFASLYTLRRGSLWGIGAIHTIWNFAQGNIFGISVSGLSGSPSVLTATASEGGALIHGGSFGMEGGLGVTIVLVIGCAVMLVMKTKKSEISSLEPPKQ
ncbi:MAG: CPBP family intramembrane metalloprotease [Clostridia bacterium]|nr:CPBP family intramembrane metalloprotease [Clostridia bacterium]